MRTPYIAANWKMHMTVPEAIGFADEFLPAIEGVGDVDVAIAPPYTILADLGRKLAGSNVRLAGQNVFYEEKGAFTGEISPGMLKDVGCSTVIIGHSERRQYFGETDETVNRRIKLALAGGLQVIFCIGETLEEREAGKTFDILKTQIGGGLAGIEYSDQLVVAYEPVWAIGTGVTASSEQAQEAHANIRGILSELYSAGQADTIRLQYGGSVKPENVATLMACQDVDGALVGGASLKADSFAKLVKFKEQG